MFRLATVVIGLTFWADLATAGSVDAKFGVQVNVIAPGAPVYTSHNARYSPGAASISLRRLGFDNLALVSRDDQTYVFQGTSHKNGLRYVITVSVWQGRVLNVIQG